MTLQFFNKIEKVQIFNINSYIVIFFSYIEFFNDFPTFWSDNYTYKSNSKQKIVNDYFRF